MALFSSLNPNSKIFLSKGLKLKMIFLKGFYLNDEGHPNISKVYQISYAYFVEIGLGNKKFYVIKTLFIIHFYKINVSIFPSHHMTCIVVEVHKLILLR